MDELYQLEAVILLLIGVLILMAIARRLTIPYPIFLVLGGLALSFVPRVPVVHLDPDLVFLVFLPPVLWAAAYFTSLRDFRFSLRTITLLAVGLVVATTVGVAAVARTIVPGMSWAAAFALGAIVSPPDAVAATAIARKLRLPHRLVTVLEGESLVNDATAIVLYRAAVAVGATGMFVASATVWQFVLAAAGGVAVGLLVGALARIALRATDDSLAAIAITLVAPYAAWILAERLHVSPVLGCVAGGIYVRQGFSEITSPIVRIQARAVWDLHVFVLNGVIFVLIGLQIGVIRQTGIPGGLAHVIATGAIISAAAIVVRLVWVPLAVVIPRLISPALRRRDPIPPWPAVFVLAWAGMRGIVSLAAALALPLSFPSRDEIILFTFGVILSTLVLQGLTLTPLIRLVGIDEDDTLQREEAYAREEAAQAGLARVEELAREPWASGTEVDRMRDRYTQRVRHASPLVLGTDEATAQAQAAYRRLRHQAIEAERRRLIALRDQGVISDEILHRLEQELDVEAMRIGLGEARPAGT
jgi:CPA1 family monovalent cation:H+ antiporter